MCELPVNLILTISPLHLCKFFVHIILDIVQFVFQDFIELVFLCEHLMHIPQCLQL